MLVTRTDARREFRGSQDEGEALHEGGGTLRMHKRERERVSERERKKSNCQ
jgi:hypothetical protein